MPDIDTPADDMARMEVSRRKLNMLRMTALDKCSMLPGSRDKAFVENIVWSKGDRLPLSNRQELHLMRLCWKYRRQMPKHLVPDISPDDPLSPYFSGFRQVVVPATSHRDIIDV